MTNLKMWSTVFPYSDWSFCNWTQNIFWAFFTSLTVERNNRRSFTQPFTGPAFSCSYLDTRTTCMTAHWPCRPATPSTLWALFSCNWSEITFLYSFLILENSWKLPFVRCTSSSLMFAFSFWISLALQILCWNKGSYPLRQFVLELLSITWSSRKKSYLTMKLLLYGNLFITLKLFWKTA